MQSIFSFVYFGNPTFQEFGLGACRWLVCWHFKNLEILRTRRMGH